MNDKWKALDSIHASQELKEKALNNILDFQEKKYHHPFKMIISFACCLFLLIGTIWYVNKPVQAASYISIDSIPSIELTLDSNDQIIEATSYNDEGRKLLDPLELKGKLYKEALQLLLQDKNLQDTNNINIVVISTKEKKVKELMNYISTHDNIENCNNASLEELEEAHSYGLSIGKYQQYLEWKKVDNQASVEDCKNMSTQEISYEIECHSHTNLVQEEIYDSEDCNNSEQSEHESHESEHDE